MMKLNFISAWAPEKELTWSGTNWGIYCALKKYYDIEDIDIGDVRPSILRGILNRITHSYDLGMGSVLAWKRYMRKRGVKPGVYFQFTDIVHDSSNIHTYVYQDCSALSVLDIANHRPEVFQYSNFATSRLNMIKKRAKMEQEYFKNCSGIFTLCHWLVDDLVKRVGLPEEKVHYVGCGINVDEAKIDGSRKKGNKIVFVGKDFERKGGVVVVNAFKELVKKMPEAQLYVAGPIENPISEDIPGYHFLGRCDRSQLNELYNECDVFAMPSYFEAFGIVFAEALCFGLPCLVRNCFDMPFIVEDGITGRVINNDDPIQIAEYLRELLTDSKYKTNVVNNREYYLSYYSWDTVAKRIHEVIG